MSQWSVLIKEKTFLEHCFNGNLWTPMLRIDSRDKGIKYKLGCWDNDPGKR